MSTETGCSSTKSMEEEIAQIQLASLGSKNHAFLLKPTGVNQTSVVCVPIKVKDITEQHSNKRKPKKSLKQTGVKQTSTCASTEIKAKHLREQHSEDKKKPKNCLKQASVKQKSTRTSSEMKVKDLTEQHSNKPKSYFKKFWLLREVICEYYRRYQKVYGKLELESIEFATVVVKAKKLLNMTWFVPSKRWLSSLSVKCKKMVPKDTVEPILDIRKIILFVLGGKGIITKEDAFAYCGVNLETFTCDRVSDASHENPRIYRAEPKTRQKSKSKDEEDKIDQVLDANCSESKACKAEPEVQKEQTGEEHKNKTELENEPNCDEQKVVTTELLQDIICEWYQRYRTRYISKTRNIKMKIVREKVKVAKALLGMNWFEPSVTWLINLYDMCTKLPLRPLSSARQIVELSMCLTESIQYVICQKGLTAKEIVSKYKIRLPYVVSLALDAQEKSLKSATSHVSDRKTIDIDPCLVESDSTDCRSPSKVQADITFSKDGLGDSSCLSTTRLEDEDKTANFKFSSDPPIEVDRTKEMSLKDKIRLIKILAVLPGCDSEQECTDSDGTTKYVYLDSNNINAQQKSVCTKLTVVKPQTDINQYAGYSEKVALLEEVIIELCRRRQQEDKIKFEEFKENIMIAKDLFAMTFFTPSSIWYNVLYEKCTKTAPHFSNQTEAGTQTIHSKISLLHEITKFVLKKNNFSANEAAIVFGLHVKNMDDSKEKKPRTLKQSVLWECKNEDTKLIQEIIVEWFQRYSRTHPNQSIPITEMIKKVKMTIELLKIHSFSPNGAWLSSLYKKCVEMTTRQDIESLPQFSSLSLNLREIAQHVLVRRVVSDSETQPSNTERIRTESKREAPGLIENESMNEPESLLLKPKLEPCEIIDLNANDCENLDQVRLNNSTMQCDIETLPLLNSASSTSPIEHKNIMVKSGDSTFQTQVSKANRVPKLSENEVSVQFPTLEPINELQETNTSSVDSLLLKPKFKPCEINDLDAYDCEKPDEGHFENFTTERYINTLSHISCASSKATKTDLSKCKKSNNVSLKRGAPASKTKPENTKRVRTEFKTKDAGLIMENKSTPTDLVLSENEGDSFALEGLNESLETHASYAESILSMPKLEPCEIIDFHANDCENPNRIFSNNSKEEFVVLDEHGTKVKLFSTMSLQDQMRIINKLDSLPDDHSKLQFARGSDIIKNIQKHSEKIKARYETLCHSNGYEYNKIKIDSKPLKHYKHKRKIGIAVLEKIVIEWFRRNTRKAFHSHSSLVDQIEIAKKFLNLPSFNYSPYKFRILHKICVMFSPNLQLSAIDILEYVLSKKGLTRDEVASVYGITFHKNVCRSIDVSNLNAREVLDKRKNQSELLREVLTEWFQQYRISNPDVTKTLLAGKANKAKRLLDMHWLSLSPNWIDSLYSKCIKMPLRKMNEQLDELPLGLITITKFILRKMGITASMAASYGICIPEDPSNEFSFFDDMEDQRMDIDPMLEKESVFEKSPSDNMMEKTLTIEKDPMIKQEFVFETTPSDSRLKNPTIDIDPMVKQEFVFETTPFNGMLEKSSTIETCSLATELKTMASIDLEPNKQIDDINFDTSSIKYEFDVFVEESNYNSAVDRPELSETLENNCFEERKCTLSFNAIADIDPLSSMASALEDIKPVIKLEGDDELWNDSTDTATETSLRCNYDTDIKLEQDDNIPIKNEPLLED